MSKNCEKIWNEVNKSDVNEIQRMHEKFSLIFMCNDGKVIGTTYENQKISLRQNAS